MSDAYDYANTYTHYGETYVDRDCDYDENLSKLLEDAIRRDYWCHGDVGDFWKMVDDDWQKLDVTEALETLTSKVLDEIQRANQRYKAKQWGVMITHPDGRECFWSSYETEKEAEVVAKSFPAAMKPRVDRKV